MASQGQSFSLQAKVYTFNRYLVDVGGNSFLPRQAMRSKRLDHTSTGLGLGFRLCSYGLKNIGALRSGSEVQREVRCFEVVYKPISTLLPNSTARLLEPDND